MTEAKKASLTVLGGSLAGARCVLPDSGVVTIGSDEGSGLQLALPGVGALHAQVVVEPGSVTVYEESGFRVFVNDSPVGEEGTLLHNGDVVWLGAPGDDEAVMLQCLIPRRPIETQAAIPSEEEAASPEATLAAIPLPAETFSEPAPAGAEEGADFAMLPEEQQAETVVLPAESGGDELVFAEEGVPAAEPVYGEAVVEPEVVEGAAEAAPHVVVPDFASEVFVEGQSAVDETYAVPEYAPVEEPGYEEAGFDAGAGETEAIEEPAPPPPPQPVLRPRVPAPPRTASPEATHPPEARAPHATHPPQARPPHATHGPQAHPPYATLPSGVRRARKARSRSRGGLIAVGALAGVAVLAGLGWAGWKLVWPRFAAPPPETPPVTVAQPTPPPITLAAAVPTQPTPAATLEPSPVSTLAAAPATAAPTTLAAAPSATPTPRTTPSPSPRVTPTPRATPTPATGRPPVTPPTTTAAGPSPASQAQALVAQAEAALAARQYEAAIGNADGALRLDPGNARATALRAEASKLRDLARRRFVSGQTVVQTQKAGNSNLSGFDTGGADVRKAPDFQGRIEFEMSPSSGLDAGTAWRLRIFVVNEGKKAIRVQGLSITTNINGAGGGATLPPQAREIAPQQRALVGETSGSWREGTTSWTSEVAVTANKGDSLRNTLTWR